jgi:multicomponent K+:H+ antiporter subunit A
VFCGSLATDRPRKPHEPTRGMLLPSALLVLACLLVGMLPAQTVGPLLATAARALLGTEVPAYTLAVWHGPNLPLLMSFLALVLGVAFYLFLHSTRRTKMRTPLLSRLNAARIYDVLSVGAIRGAGRLTRTLFSWRLQPLLLLIVCAALVAGLLPLAIAGWSRGPEPHTPLDPLFLLLWLVGGACALGAAFQAKYHRLAALILVGGVGLVTCLTFAWFSAPDVALTQIAVEVVMVVLILLGLRWLPRRLAYIDARRETTLAKVRRARDGIVAVVGGAGFAALAYAVLTRPSTAEYAPFYIRNALEVADGRNVVNVILVDFRGFDTLAEITVVGIVAMIVYALLRRFRPAHEVMEVPRAQRREGAIELPPSNPQELLSAGDLRIPAVLTRLLLPMAGMVSLYFLLRGHNAPGGGFVGGLVMATAVIIQYMIGGTMWVEARLRVHPLYWMGLGLLAAAGAGLIAWFSGLPFLTARSVHLHLPLLGDLHLSTVLLFDLGVYMLVVGATMLMLVALAHQSLRSPRRAVTHTHPEAEHEGGSGLGRMGG